MNRVMVGLGELLWDMLPTGARLGGAPANFAYIASMLGASSAVVSRVGNDEIGDEARRFLAEHGLDVRNVQVDAEHATGTVAVAISANGMPSYSILEDVAWDHVRWTLEMAELASSADAVCFGTLAQRCATTRNTVRTFLDHTPRHCLRILDVNCRMPFCSAETVRESLDKANVLKLSSEELSIVLDACAMTAMSEAAAAVALQRKFDFKAVCITRGAEGSVIAMEGSSDTHPGIKVEVADTVGAGDAFVAALAHCLLNGLTLKATNDAANRVAAWVASRCGAMPVADVREREELRGLVGNGALR